MAVMDWLCDCCGYQFGMDDQRVMFMQRMGLAEDRCTKCISHDKHCMDKDETEGK